MIRNCFIKLQILILAAAGCLFTVSCSQIDVYEKHTVIPAYEWQDSFSATGDFLITDTVSAYSIYLWLNIGLQPPGDSMYIQKVNLSLGDDANGWEGSGMNDIWELRKLLNGEPRRFKQAGKYQFTISHIMRDNPLLHVMSVGLRVEKIKN